jgi:tripartite-type tricarboxylate transporter receptor subunit TctC
MLASANLASRRRVLLAVCASLGMNALAQQLADFPTGTVKLIVPFPPGSGADITARSFATVITQITGHACIVENKAGANGVIAVESMLQAKPDGHTILLGSNSTLSTNAALIPKLSYDPLRDLAAITVIGRAPAVVVVPPNSPYSTLAALIADAKKRPGSLNYGSGSPSYTLYSEWLGELAGFKAANIPYKGAGDAIAAVAGGQIDFAVVDGSGAIPIIAGKKIRGLVIGDSKRSPAIPDVPSAPEAGVPGFMAFNWTAAAVSAKTPPAVISAIEALFMKVGQSKSVIEVFEKTNSQLLMLNSTQMRNFQEEEIARWKRIAAAANIKLD